MTKLTNQSVVEVYFNGGYAGKTIESHSGNLWISDDRTRLMNYATCLVERNAELGKMIVNRTSYSNSTSKIQGYIMSQLWRSFGGDWIEENVIQVDNVQISTNYLLSAANKKLEWLKGMKPVKLINYFDVWGNKKDGWEVNNMCTESEFELHEDVTDKEILQSLKNVGFMKTTTRMTQLVFEDLHDFGVEIYQKKDMQPICRVEFVGGRY